MSDLRGAPTIVGTPILDGHVIGERWVGESLDILDRVIIREGPRWTEGEEGGWSPRNRVFSISGEEFYRLVVDSRGGNVE
jgi:hypothetical protein